MRRVRAADTPGADDTLFGGLGGHTEGSPPTIPATTVKARTMNIVQEEICRAITNAGITLDQATTDEATHNKEQLFRAMMAVSGGGAKLKFRPLAGSGAVEQEINGFKVFTFSAGAGQSIVAEFKVPDRYQAGQKMDVVWSWFAAATTGNVDWDVTINLYKLAAAVTSPSDSATPSVGAVSLGSPSSALRSSSAEVIDSAGEVDTTAVAAGDIIQIIITRNSGDTATVDAQIFAEQLEGKLT